MVDTFVWGFFALGKTSSFPCKPSILWADEGLEKIGDWRFTQMACPGPLEEFVEVDPSLPHFSLVPEYRDRLC